MNFFRKPPLTIRELFLQRTVFYTDLPLGIIQAHTSADCLWATGTFRRPYRSGIAIRWNFSVTWLSATSNVASVALDGRIRFIASVS